MAGRLPASVWDEDRRSFVSQMPFFFRNRSTATETLVSELLGGGGVEYDIQRLMRVCSLHGTATVAKLVITGT